MINSCEPKHLTLFANIAMARRVFKLIMSHAKRFSTQNPPSSKLPIFISTGREVCVFRLPFPLLLASRLMQQHFGQVSLLQTPMAHGSSLPGFSIHHSPFPTPDICPRPAWMQSTENFFAAYLPRGCKRGISGLVGPATRLQVPVNPS